ncbi:MAG: DUF2849 domain-containing protein [Gammaproteobacteria bacterium]|nr:DUF2849 domain-containing protein [Gammaproteobacteria bacterium]
MPHMVIANTLRDGRVVFLSHDGSWAAAIADGELAQNETAASRLLADSKSSANSNVVIDPQLIEVNETDHGRQPTAYREYIRAYGPSVRNPG